MPKLIAVVTVQAVVGGDPDEAVPVLDDGVGRVVGKAVLRPQTLETELVRALSRDPEEGRDRGEQGDLGPPGSRGLAPVDSSCCTKHCRRVYLRAPVTRSTCAPPAESSL